MIPFEIVISEAEDCPQIVADRNMNFFSPSTTAPSPHQHHPADKQTRSEYYNIITIDLSIEKTKEIKKNRPANFALIQHCNNCGIGKEQPVLYLLQTSCCQAAADFRRGKPQKEVIKMQILHMVLSYAMPVICAAMLGTLIGLLRKFSREWKALKEANKCLLRADIIKFCTNAQKDGYISVSYREALNRSHNAYRALGGNDVVCELYSKAMQLPVQPPIGEK